QELVADAMHNAGLVRGEFEKRRPPVVRIDNRPDAAFGEIGKEDRSGLVVIGKLRPRAAASQVHGKNAD
ncbi:hypothetical protein NZA98_03600, partial [Escherichia coli]|nr:hypothetical protein [Escherichia coli]